MVFVKELEERQFSGRLFELKMNKISSFPIFRESLYLCILVYRGTRSEGSLFEKAL